MRQFKFIGNNPEEYMWNFPLEPGKVYDGPTPAVDETTIEEIMDMAHDPNFDSGVDEEWEEVING